MIIIIHTYKLIKPNNGCDYDYFCLSLFKCELCKWKMQSINFGNYKNHSIAGFRNFNCSYAFSLRILISCTKKYNDNLYFESYTFVP